MPMRDGVVLRADHYAPAPREVAGTPARSMAAWRSALPTVLVRTPYGRGGLVRLLAAAVAERGQHVLIQSCRGTADSGGQFEPLLRERDDGSDTLRWLGRQPWYEGRLATFGVSYVGLAHWALAPEAGRQLAGMVAMITTSDFGPPTYIGGSFSLDSVLTWAAVLAGQDRPVLANLAEQLRGLPRLQRGLDHLPLGGADEVATGNQVSFFQEWLRERDPVGGYWQARSQQASLAGIKAPVLLVGGWYDIFLPGQLYDFAALEAAGAGPRLVIGPWTHGSIDMYRRTMRSALGVLRGDQGPEIAVPDAAGPEAQLPVLIHVGGVDQWRRLPTWPPPQARSRRWYLRAGGGLGPTLDGQPPVSGAGAAGEPPGPEGPEGTEGADTAGRRVDRFRYDPADPTPALGGPRLLGQRAGRRDNRSHEARTDVLTFTSPPLPRAIEVIGPVQAVIQLQVSRPFFDVFVRLCDVDQAGRSWNICDGLTRVTPDGYEPDPSGVYAVPVSLWPAAHRFAAGHRLRIQVSGGAHPRFARNPGTGEPLEVLSGLQPVEQTIICDRDHVSFVALPECPVLGGCNPFQQRLEISCSSSAAQMSGNCPKPQSV